MLAAAACAGVGKGFQLSLGAELLELHTLDKDVFPGMPRTIPNAHPSGLISELRPLEAASFRPQTVLCHRVRCKA